MEELIDYIEQLKYELRFLKPALLEEIVETYQRKIDLKVEQKEKAKKILKSLPTIEELKQQYIDIYGDKDLKKITFKRILKICLNSIYILIIILIFASISYSSLIYIVPYNVFKMLPNLSTTDSIIALCIFLTCVGVVLITLALILEFLIKEVLRIVNQIYFHIHLENKDFNRGLKFSIFKNNKKYYKKIAICFGVCSSLLIILILSSYFSNGIIKNIRLENKFLKKEEVIVNHDFLNIKYSGSDIILEIIESENETNKIAFLYDYQDMISYKIDNQDLVIEYNYSISNNILFKEKLPKLILYTKALENFTLNMRTCNLALENFKMDNLTIDSSKNVNIKLKNTEINNFKVNGFSTYFDIESSLISQIEVNAVSAIEYKMSDSTIDNLKFESNGTNLRLLDTTIKNINIDTNLFICVFTKVENENFKLIVKQEHNMKFNYLKSNKIDFETKIGEFYIFKSEIETLNLKTLGAVEFENNNINVLNLDISGNLNDLDECIIETLNIKSNLAILTITKSNIKNANFETLNSIFKLYNSDFENVSITDNNSGFRINGGKFLEIRFTGITSNLQISSIKAELFDVIMENGSLTIKGTNLINQLEKIINKLIITLINCNKDIDESIINEIIELERENR